VGDENGDLLADSCNILNRWKNYFSQLLNVHRISGVRQTEIHTAELLTPDRSPFQVEIAISKLKMYKSSGSDQIPAELIQAGGEILHSKMHKLILFGIRKNCLISGRSLFLYQFTRRAIKLTVVIIVGYHCLSTSYKILSSILLSRLSPYVDAIIGDHHCGFQYNRSTAEHIFFFIHQILEKDWEYNEAVHKLFRHFKRAYDSVRRDVLYNILS
jgi:hypothetical protein